MELTLETIRAAHARIAPYIVQTPLLRLPALDDALGCEVYAKAECMQRTGAFKLRGAMNKILALTEDERARGFVAASSGNHGRAVAYAAQRFGTHACIVMPRTAPPVKQAAIRALGAELVLCEASERFDVAARLCAERGATMVPPFNDEAVMAGMGGILICGILENCPYRNDKAFVLQPMSDPDTVRSWLYANGFDITKEKAVCEGKRVYVVMRAEYCGKSHRPTDFEALVGTLAQSPSAAEFEYFKKLSRTLDRQIKGQNQAGEDTSSVKELKRQIDSLLR